MDQLALAEALCHEVGVEEEKQHGGCGPAAPQEAATGRRQGSEPPSSASSSANAAAARPVVPWVARIHRHRTPLPPWATGVASAHRDSTPRPHAQVDLYMEWICRQVFESVGTTQKLLLFF